MKVDAEALRRRNIVIAKIMAQYDEGQPYEVLPVVSLEDSFEAN